MFLILYTQSLQKSMQEHFAAYGSVTDISFQIDETDESKSPFALVTFASRSDAEKVGCLCMRFDIHQLCIMAYLIYILTS